ncbi:hypothetical protein ScPMuIL_005011 [Solemya velum]
MIAGVVVMAVWTHCSLGFVARGITEPKIPLTQCKQLQLTPGLRVWTGDCPVVSNSQPVSGAEKRDMSQDGSHLNCTMCYLAIARILNYGRPSLVGKEYDEYEFCLNHTECYSSEYPAESIKREPMKRNSIGKPQD